MMLSVPTPVISPVETVSSVSSVLGRAKGRESFVALGTINKAELSKDLPYLSGLKLKK
jgi:hypothetical protein